MSAVSSLHKKYNEEVRPFLMNTFGIKNVHQVPRLEKVVLSRGFGSEVATNAKVIDISQDQVYRISGQKAKLTKAKVSISNFKLREGQVIGCFVTLRGERMYAFLTKLFNAALPKIRDFRGIECKADKFGNFTFGVKETRIFPEVIDEDRSRGFSITLVSSGNDTAVNAVLLKMLGMPFSARHYKHLTSKLSGLGE